MEVAVEELAKWLAFYRRMWSRGAANPGQPGPYARFYEADVRALEDAVRKVQRREA